MKKSPLAVILCNLGTPEQPTPSAVRAFLKEFLSDPRVVEVPRVLWWMILNGFILPFRPKPVASAYRSLWEKYGDSPLRLTSCRQAESLGSMLEGRFGKNEVLVDYAFSYGSPSISSQLDKYREKAEKILLLPLYPQYSCSTTAAVYDQLARYNLRQRNVADVAIHKHYYAHPAFRQALAGSVAEFWKQHGRGEHLLVSSHGVPQGYADKGDPYYQQCIDTARNLQADLGLADDQISWSFQSRFGKAEWVKPYTDATVRELAGKGIRRLDVVCPSFSVDCLETLEEIAVENAHFFTENGGESLRLIHCLNDRPQHIAMMAEIVVDYYMQSKNQSAEQVKDPGKCSHE